MKCLRCGNEDSLYFFNDHGRYYCRRCIAFGRVDVNELPEVKPYQRRVCDSAYTLQYPLTSKQRILAKQILDLLCQQKDVLVYAACGARKNRIDNGGYQVLFKSWQKSWFCDIT